MFQYGRYLLISSGWLNSHRRGVYPSREIAWQDDKFYPAARQSLTCRGDGGTGWSLAWKINLCARGGFEVDMRRKGGKLSAAGIHRISGGACRVRHGARVLNLVLPPGSRQRKGRSI